MVVDYLVFVWIDLVCYLVFVVYFMWVEVLLVFVDMLFV